MSDTKTVIPNFPPLAHAVTFGRFNIPHHGHVELIKAMLARAEYAHVYFSTAQGNNELYMRKALLSSLCVTHEVDLSRVLLKHGRSPFQAVEELRETTGDPDPLLVFGFDEERLVAALIKEYGCGICLNRRSTSSTELRAIIDKTGIAGAYSFYGQNNGMLHALMAVTLREEELSREKHSKIRGKAKASCKEPNQAEASAKLASDGSI